MSSTLRVIIGGFEFIFLLEKCLFFLGDDPTSQVCRLLFGKWGSLKSDFLPLFCSNLKNEKMTFLLLIMLNYLTGEIEEEADFKETLSAQLYVKMKI